MTDEQDAVNRRLRENVLVRAPAGDDWPTLNEYAYQGRVAGVFDAYTHSELYLGRDANEVFEEQRGIYRETRRWAGTFEELRVYLFVAARTAREEFDAERDHLTELQSLVRTLREIGPQLERTLPRLVLASGSEDAPERSYWVARRWLLAGAYPGHPIASQHAARVGALWDAGCRTFINLIEERERNKAGKPFASYVGALDDAASRGTERPTCLRFPVRDVSAPSREMMRSILDAIDLSLEACRPVYVHCFGGVGRTATVVGCWLLRHGLASPGDVLDVLTRLRTADKVAGQRPAPESADQTDLVRTWLG